MQTILHHIEYYYREVYGKKPDQVIDNGTSISVYIDCKLVHYIDNNLVKSNEELIAWLDKTDVTAGLKIIVYNTTQKTAATFPLNGEPDMDGYEFYCFTWIDKSLFCVYQGDHDHFHIHTIENNTSKYIYVRGDAVRVFENFLTFQQFGKDQPVYKVAIPQLTITDQFSETAAKALDIFPVGLGLIYNADHNFYALD